MENDKSQANWQDQNCKCINNICDCKPHKIEVNVSLQNKIEAGEINKDVKDNNLDLLKSHTPNNLIYENIGPRTIEETKYHLNYILGVKLILPNYADYFLDNNIKHHDIIPNFFKQSETFTRHIIQFPNDIANKKCALSLLI